MSATVREGPGRPRRPSSGAYQTQWFFGGYMTLRTERAWTGLEDSTGELKIASATDSECGVGSRSTSTRC